MERLSLLQERTLKGERAKGGQQQQLASPRCGAFLSPRKPNSYLTAELKGASSSEADVNRITPVKDRVRARSGMAALGDGLAFDRRSASSRTPSKASLKKRRQEDLEYNMSQERVIEWLVNDTICDTDDPSPIKEVVVET